MPPQTGEAGFTLIEMVMVLVLASILGVFIFGTLTKCLVTQVTMQKRKERNDDAILSMEKMNRELREAKGDNFYAGNVDGVPVLVFEKNVTSSTDTNTFIKYALNVPEKRLMRQSVATVGAIPWFVHNTGDVIATNVVFFWSKDISHQGINIGLKFDDGSDWQTNILRRNLSL